MAKKVDQNSGCIICGKAKGRISRGLCTLHYMQYRRHRETLTDEAADAWEAELIESGKLLPNRQGQKGPGGNAFADLFDQFVAKHPGAIKTVSDEELAEQEARNAAADAVVDRELTQAKAKKTGKSTSRKKGAG